MPLTSQQEQDLLDLPEYNNNVYNASSNPKGLDGDGHRINFVVILGKVASVVTGAVALVTDALGYASDAADALAAAITAQSGAEDARDAAQQAQSDAEAAAEAAENFDPANYARSDTGQSSSINAIWTFLQNIILTDKDVVRNSIVQTRITKRAIVATGSSSITFPASPTNMDRAIFYFNGDYQSSPAVIGRNGSNVNGLAEDLTVDNINGVEVVEFEYYQAASSWGVV